MTTLLVLAAGMGTRYGGLKQMDPVGPSGESLLDYSLFDAIRAGCQRVVFVIRRDFEEDFREKVGRRFEDRLDVGYVFQQLNDLPGGFSVPAGRTKPWGTGHAIWCAREAINHSFLAINADDFYGYPAIRAVCDFLHANTTPDACMAGYRLESTLSEHGTVSRGICDLMAEGILAGITEHTQIRKDRGTILDEATGRKFHGDERVSLNCWGFPNRIFALLEELFDRFLVAEGTQEKSEFYIPSAVASLIQNGTLATTVLSVESTWFGITYREDREHVKDSLRTLTAQGLYPPSLWES